MESVQLHILYNPWNSPGQNTGLGNCSLFQGIFPTQGSNPGLLHCKGILYQLSYQGRHIYIYIYDSQLEGKVNQLKLIQN